MDTSELGALASDCVHCGFCLPSCPTYQLWGEEMDSPRGRIHLVAQVLGGAELTEAAVSHFDRCLGCMACMTACPSGVRYDRLIEAARAWTDGEGLPAGNVPQADSGVPARTRAGGDLPAVSGIQAANGSPGFHDGEGRQAGTGLQEVRGPAGPAGSASSPPGASGTGGARLRAAYRRPLRERAARAAIFALFPYPRRLRALAGPLRGAQWAGLDRLASRSGLPARLSPVLDAAMRLAPAPAAPQPAGRLPERVPARGARRAVVGMLTGCVQSVFFSQVNVATARVLAAEGCDVIIPRGQSCCGALSLHSGRTAEAAAFARRTIETFEQAGVDAIVVNSAGCGSAMKEYADLLAGEVGWERRAKALSARTCDFAEFLAGLFEDAGGPAAARHPLPVRAAYHDACHLAHAQRVTSAPRALLRGIPGLSLLEVGDAGTCCGSAGVYNLLQPEPARELGDRKADSVLATGAALLISANPGCSLQIASALQARGERIAVAHPAEVLDASIRGLPASALGA